jgi:hypothetical protein
VFWLLALETRHTEKTCGITDYQTLMKKPMASNGLAIGKKVVGITNVWLYDKH